MKTHSELAWRCERKFPGEVVNPKEIEGIIPYLGLDFKKVFRPRQVNSIYFDSEDLTSVRENIEGEAHRAKMRIRWYGSFLGIVPNPILEIKIKRGLAGRKDRFSLGHFSMSEKLNPAQLKAKSKSWKLPGWVTEALAGNMRLLTVSYFRRYYTFSSGRVRVTLDSHIRMGRFSKKGWKAIPPWITAKQFVLEVKYDPKDETEAMAVTQNLPFRLDKFSKYVTGIHADSLY